MSETQGGTDASSFSELIDEEARRKFEAAWSQGRPEPIERFLPGEGDAGYLPTLEELVCVELELAWKAAGGRPEPVRADSGPRVEAYLGRFPVLTRPECLLRLLREEYRVRRRRGDRPSVEEYRQRFPEVVPTGEEIGDSGSESGPALPRAPAAAVEESYDFLAPAVGPGEMGWLGPYRVLKVLGTGGMGIVFEAEDPQRGGRVALKTMKPSIAAGAPERRRFLREARAAAALSHDNIVSICRVDEDRDCPFIAMPLLEGSTLEEHIRAQRVWTVTELLHIGREIAQGLAAAHQCGLVHRDIKPSNIWVEPLGEMKGPPTIPYRLKILDFGLVKILDSELAPGGGDLSYLTGLGTVVGTPAYMSPEQARCAPIDYRCDLFSLGCILYRLSTTRPAFTGADAVSVLSAVISDTPEPPGKLRPDLPKEFADLVVQLMAKDPEGRPQSAAAVVEAIRSLEENLQGQAGAGRGTPDTAATPYPPAQAGTPAGRMAGFRRAMGVLRRRFGWGRDEIQPAAAETAPREPTAGAGDQGGV